MATKSGPKKQNRIAIYPRVTKENQLWIRKMAKSVKASEAIVVDRVLLHARRRMGITTLLKLING